MKSQKKKKFATDAIHFDFGIGSRCAFWRIISFTKKKAENWVITFEFELKYRNTPYLILGTDVFLEGSIRDQMLSVK